VAPVFEVRPNPSWHQRITAVPWAIFAMLRTAWKATWGSLAHACTQMSPLQIFGSSSSAGRCGIGRSSSGRSEASPKRSSNRDGPKPTVIVRSAGPSPTASPVSSGGTSGSLFSAPAGSPSVIRAAASVHSLISVRRSSGSSAVMSKEAKWSRSCAGVVIPAWCSP